MKTIIEIEIGMRFRIPGKSKKARLVIQRLAKVKDDLLGIKCSFDESHMADAAEILESLVALRRRAAAVSK